MPSRVIKESILTSDNFNKMGMAAQNFIFRLFVKVDDYGRFEARIPVLRAALFPMCLDMVSEADVSGMLVEAEKNDLIRRYVVDGKPFLVFLTWPKHNRVRAKESKYPSPPAHASTRKHIPPESDTESKSDSNTESDAESGNSEFEPATPERPPLPLGETSEITGEVDTLALGTTLGLPNVAGQTDVMIWQSLQNKGATLDDLRAAKDVLLSRKKPISIKNLSNPLIQTVTLEQMEKRLALDRRNRADKDKQEALEAWARDETHSEGTVIDIEKAGVS